MLEDDHARAVGLRTLLREDQAPTQADDVITVTVVAGLRADYLATLLVSSTDPKAALAGVLEAHAATCLRTQGPQQQAAHRMLELARRLRAQRTSL